MKPIEFLLYCVVVFGWSTSWLPLKWQLGVVAPEVSLFWRFLIAATVMFIISFSLRQSLKFDWRTHLHTALLGLFIFSTNFAFFYHGGKGVASGLLAVVFSSASLVNVVMIAVLGRSRPRFTHLLAAGVGLTGVVCLFWRELELSDTALTSLGLCLIGTLFFCTGNMVSAACQKRGIPLFASISWGMFYGACFLALFSLISHHEFIIEPTAKYVLGLVWLAVVSSVMTFAAYLALIGRIGAGRAGYATVIFPVFALLISTMFESFAWSGLAFFGLALVICGNVIMLRARA
jgi:drug/metabolite transporter (DMT)-like permease